MNRALFALIVTGALISGVPAYAHHSFAATYFEDKSVTIEGKLVEFDCRNPHSFVTLEVADAQGKVDLWAAEWRSSGRLTRDGLSKDSLHPGDHVIIASI
jgi:23S rRNA maturation-related 3'-5' exoribonuclease YhaM